jgi:tRNA modification GTPase
MNPADTIVAVSSAVGPAARMIVRVSGPGARRIAGQLTGLQTDTEGAGATRERLRFAGLAVPGWLYVFRGPRSYTGDDLVEFHIPGNPVLARLLLDHLRGAGARDAGAGEFTARAFFNGRLDLTEAEGVAATIAAQGEDELAAARQLMAGELARRLRPVTDQLAQTLALVEAGIDFSDEDVTFLSADQVRTRIAEADGALERLLGDSARFERLAHEPTAVLVGRPNAGKSTLLNALAGRARAVTSPVAGTTRDVLSAEVALERGMIRLVDAAGLEPAQHPASAEDAATESIRRQMRERALSAVESADVVLLVQDATDPQPPPRLDRPPDLVVRTKADPLRSAAALPSGPSAIAVSALTGDNMDGLRRRLDRLAFGERTARPTLALNARHVESVREARGALARASDRAGDASAEVVALELREALDALGRVIGAVTPDDLLGRIFSTFCIGK